ncbi:MAG: hypothetical protein JXQ73_28855 [Phycisphaerae bacterium]|nr:hypothetical protein [Phycisphaerae bacterium]
MNLASYCVWLTVIAPATARHWDFGDPHVMQQAQPPEPNGWSIRVSQSWMADTWRGWADDWQCAQSGYINDMSFWGTTADANGLPGDVLLIILANDASGPVDRPGEALWWKGIPGEQVSVRYWDQVDLGIYDPYSPSPFPLAFPPFEQAVYQFTINDLASIEAVYLSSTDSPFFQEEGQTYWLSLTVLDGDPWGWCTSGERFGGTAYSSIWYGSAEVIEWYEMTDPVSEGPLDMAFVVMPEPASLGYVVLAGASLLLHRRSRPSRR